MTELVGPLASTGYWVKQAALSWQRELDGALRDLDLTSTQFSVLAGASWLSRGGHHPVQQEIADFAGADRMMTSKLLQLLESRGLVERRPDADDARVRRIEPTAAGRALVLEASARARRVDQRLFDDDTSVRDLLYARFGPAGPLPARAAAPAEWSGND